MANIPFLNNAYFSAKVGIGTDSPIDVLSLEKTTNINVLTDYKNSTGNFSTGVLVGGNFAINESNVATRLTIEKTSGNVGIGTTSPTDYGATANTLEVRGASGTGAGLIRVSNAGNTVGASFYSASAASTLGTQTAHPLDFVTNNSKKMTITSAGNVGIGTDSPTSLLEISQQLSAVSTIDYPYTISSRDDGNSINQAGGEGVGIKFRIAGNDGTTPGNSLVGASIAAIRETASDTNSSTGLGFFVTQDDETLDEALRIDHDGNVGIGTTSPGFKLDVAGSANNADIGIRINNTFDDNDPASEPNAVLFINAASNNGYLRVHGAPANTAAKHQIDLGSTAGSSFLTFSPGGAERMRIATDGAIQFNDYGAGTLVSDASGNITVSSGGGAGGPYLPLAGGTMTGTITMNNNRITSIEELRFNNGGNIGNQINTDVDTGTETVANVEIATYTAAFFDFVIKKTTNVRSGTVYACHDGTNVEFTETSTNDLGDTSDVTLSVDISGTNMRLLATVTSDDWSVKSLIRAI